MMEAMSLSCRSSTIVAQRFMEFMIVGRRFGDGIELAQAR